MSVQTLRLGGREFVILPKREYDRMREKAQRLSEQDVGDIAESKRRLADKSRPIPLEDARRRLRL